MAVSSSWLIEGRVLFVTASGSLSSVAELQEAASQIQRRISETQSPAPCYFIHDLRAIDDRKQVIAYVNALYPRLISSGRQVLLLSDSFWALEKRLLRRALRHYDPQVIVYSLDDSFRALQQIDSSLPSLRAAFRARVRNLIQRPVEPVSD